MITSNFNLIGPLVVPQVNTCLTCVLSIGLIAINSMDIPQYSIFHQSLVLSLDTVLWTQKVFPLGIWKSNDSFSYILFEYVDGLVVHIILLLEDQIVWHQIILCLTGIWYMEQLYLLFWLLLKLWRIRDVYRSQEYCILICMLLKSWCVQSTMSYFGYKEVVGSKL